MEPFATANNDNSTAATSREDAASQFNWMLMKWLVQSSLPPSSLEKLRPNFLFLNPSVQIWSGDKFSEVIQEAFENMRDEVKVIIDEISSKICLTVDFWESTEKFQYMSITAHWIDESWDLQKMLLDVCKIDRRCWYDVSRFLLKVINMYNISNKVLCCTYGYLKEEDMGDNTKFQFHHFPCFGHTLNSIVDDALSHSQSIIFKTREIVEKMNASSYLSGVFLLSCDVNGEDKWEFPIDASCRWSGKFQMIEIARKAIKSMDTIIQNNVDLESRLQLNRVEKNDVKLTYAYLKTFSEAIKHMCTDRFLTVGVVFLFMDHLLSKVIIPCQVHETYPTWLTEAAKDMATKARSYNAKVFNGFTFMSAILDPRIKLELLPKGLNSEKYLIEAGCYPSFSSCPEGIAFREEVAHEKLVKNELNQYLSEPPVEITTDVLGWWRMNSATYPRLSVMARDFLAVQATSLALEDLFSSKGDEIDKQRLSTPSESTQALHCVKSWMQSKIKLKYRSAEIDYENLGEL